MSTRRRRRRKMSRTLLYWIGGGIAAAVLVPILVFAVLIATIDPNSFKEQLEGSLRKVLGRDLHIRGQLSVSASLSPRLEADDVTLINMPTGSRADMVRIEHMQIDIATRALLTGRLVISRISLTKPDILIETDRNGAGNWAYKPAAPLDDEEGANLALVTLHLRDGRITWRNGQTGESVVVELRRLQMGSATPEAPVLISAEAAYARQRINIAAQTGPWSRLLDGNARTPWGVFANFESGGAKLTVTGALSRPQELRGYSLRVDASAPDLGQLGWLLPWRVLPLHNVSLSGRLLDTGGDYPDLTGVVMKSGFTNLDKVAPGLSLETFALELPRLSEQLTIAAEGTYASAPLRIAGTFGAPNLLLPNAPAGTYNVDLRMEAAGATFAARGSITDPAGGKGMDIGIGARVPDLGLLAPLIGIRLPVIRNLAFTGQMMDGEGGFREALTLNSIVLSMPQLDLAGTAGLILAEHPRLRVGLTGRLADVDALLAAWEASRPQEQDGARRLGAAARTVDVIAPPPMPSRGLTVIPDIRLPVEGLRAMDADLRLGIEQLRHAGVLYRDVQASAVLSNGRLLIDPLSADLQGGHAEARLAITADGATPRVNLRLKAAGIDLDPLLKAWDVPPLMTGRFDADTELSAAGATVHDLAAAASGRIRLALADGKLDTSKAAGPAATVHAAIRAGTDRLETGEMPLRCAALGLDVADGVARVSEAGIDTSRLIGLAAGSINLRDETLALQLRPNLRNGAALAAVPLRMDGGWREPRLAPDTGAAPRFPTEGCGVIATGAAPLTARVPLAIAPPATRAP